MGRKRTPEPEQIDRERQVLELRRTGATWDAIAQVVGYASPASAYKAYQRAMTRTLQQPADELREAEIDRLDRLMRAYWQEAIGSRDERGVVTAGNIRAADFILRVIDRRAKLLGLDAPQKIQAEVVNYDGHAIDADVERLVHYLRGMDQGGPMALEAGTGED